MTGHGALPLVAALDRAGHRLTGPRRAIAELISGRGGAAFTAAELNAELHGRGVRVGRATVFRVIDLLATNGLVERVDLLSGEHAYVACTPEHHHHVLCSRCARAVDIGDVGLGDVAAEVARRTGYRVDEHRLMLFGVCPDCQATEAAGAAGSGA